MYQSFGPKMASFLRASSLVGICFLTESAWADLNVDDSMNRYSLFGKRGIQMDQYAKTAKGGFVGSDVVLRIGGDDTLLAPMLSAGDLVMNNIGNNWYKEVVRVGRNLTGTTSWHNQTFDSVVYVGRDLGMLQHANVFKKQVNVGNSLIKETWANTNSFNGVPFTQNGQSVFNSPYSISGVNWGVTPQTVIPVNMPWPDTTFTPRAGVDIKTGPLSPVSGGSRRWSCGTNAASGGSDLVLLGICQPNDTVLPPGNYDLMDIWFGSTVYIGEGVYSFNFINLQNALGNGATTRLLAVQPTGAHTILLTKNGLKVNPSGSFNIIAPEKYKLGYGIDSTHFAGGTMMIYSESSLHLDVSTEIWASVVVPKPGTMVKLSDRVHLFGQILADSIHVLNYFKGTDGAFIPIFRDKPKISMVSKVNASVLEPDLINGKPDTISLNFPITMDHINGEVVKVFYHTRRHTGGLAPADPGIDYLNVSGMVAIMPTFLGDTVRVKVLGDVVWEGDETIELVVDSVKNADLGKTHADSVAVGTIIDNDQPPVVYFERTTDTVSEGASLNLRARLTFQIGRSLTVPYSVVSGTSLRATEGADFSLLPSPKVLSFPAYSDTASVRVTAVADGMWEPTEKFAVKLETPSITAVTIDPARGADTVAILSPDPIPPLVINDTLVPEGGSAFLRVGLGGVGRSGDSACFDWTTLVPKASDSATTGLDFTSRSGHDCIPAGATGITLPAIAVLDDTLFEIPERFLVRLTPTFGAAGPDTGTVTITNTDAAPTLIVDDVTQKRPTSGTVVYRFKVRLVDRASGKPTISGADAVFSWQTLRGTALPALDYDSTGATSVRFRALTDSVMYLAVTVRGSAQYHANALQFKVATSAISGLDVGSAATAKKLEGVGTITTAVGAPRLRWVADTVNEGAQGTSTYIHMRASLVDSLGNPTTSRDPVALVWSTQDSNATVAAGHYVPVVQKVLTIAAGKQSLVDSVEVVGNDLYQPSPRFLKGLIEHADARASGYDKAQSQTRALGGILDSDIAPLVQAVDAPTETEGNAGMNAFRFVVRLDRPSGLPFTYSWKTTSTGSATSGIDYTAVAATNRTIAAGQTADTVYVQVVGDLRLEKDETFGVAFTPLAGSRSSTVVNVSGTILNDDSRPRLQIQVDSSVVEGNSGTHSLTFRATLLDSLSGQPVSVANAPDLPISFWWRTEDLSATTSDNDYVGVAGRWDTIIAGQSSRSLSVLVRGDTRYERDEALRIRLDTLRDAASTGNTLWDTAWITNDDLQPRVSIRDTSVNEPATYGAASQMAFVVTLSAPSGVPVRLDWQTVSHTAMGTDSFNLARGDYRNFDSVTLVFAPDEVKKTILVPVYGDTIFEKSEDFYLLLGPVTDAQFDRDRATGTIVDADTAPAIRILDAALVSEGAKANFLVRLDRPSEVPVRFRLVSRNGTATAGADFRGLDTNLVMTALTVTKPIEIQTHLDTVANERIEDFRLALLSIQDAFAADTTGTGRIQDVNPKPSVSIDSVQDVDEADTTIHFTVRISQVSAVPVQIQFGTVGATALANADFKDTSGTLVIPAMTSRVKLPSRIFADLIDEDPVENYLMKLRSVLDTSLAAISDSLGQAGILDDDPPPALSVSDATLLEPAVAGASANMTFTVRLDAPSGKSVGVSWRTVDSTAKVSDKDYTAGSGSLRFAPGETLKTFTVAVLGDSLDEYDEFLKVQLLGASNATVADGNGVGTIQDNDTAPAVRINDPVVREGTGIDIRANFTATLDRVSAKNVTIHWATRDSTAKSTGASGSDTYDFLAASGDVTIPAGSKSVSIPVTVKSDNYGEPTEYFSLLLTPTTNVDPSRSDTVGVCTIFDGNGLPALYIDSVAPVVEADSTIRFQLRLQFPRSDAIHVKFRTVAGTATAVEDFRDTSGTITIAPGATSYNLDIGIRDDRFNEPDTEFFQVQLIEADSANIVDSIGLASILDDDLPPTVSVLDDVVVEPAAYGALDSLHMKVVLSVPSNVPSTVDWRTVDGSAKGTFDYIDAMGTIVFQPGDSVVVVSVPVVGDSLDEPDETLDVRLSSPMDASLADSIGVGTITDNDTAPGIHVYGTRTTEPATGSVAAVFRVRLDRPSGKAIAFHWASADGTAKAGLDYDAGSGDISLPIGRLDTLVRVSVRADSIAGEGDETYQVKLSAISNALPSDTLATGTIVDLQGLPGVSIFSIAPVEERDSTIHFVVRLNWYPANPVRVWLHTQAGSAAPGVRYVDTAGSILFPAMGRVDSFGVRILNDHISERIPETFLMLLDSAKTANILDPVGTATLLDDGDEPPVVMGNADTVTEGSIARFPVRVTGQTKDTVWVYWSTRDSSASSVAKDFRADSGTLVFLPGQRLLHVEIPVLSDTVWEPVESFKVVIDSVRRGLLSARDRQGIAWVKDDGNPPRMSFGNADTSVVEDVAGDVPVRIVLDRPASIDLAVVISVASTSSATQGTDYSLRNLLGDTLKIPAGATSARFHVRVVPDSVDEYDETVDLTMRPLSPAGAGTLLSHRLTIVDDDAAPSLVFKMDTMTVVENVGQVKVVAHLSRVSGKPVSASYHVQGTASPGIDHDIATGQLVGFFFAAGVDTASRTFGVIDDRITEPTETVELVLDSARNASLLVGQSSQIVRILDNDSAPVVSFARRDTTVREDAGTIGLDLILDHPSAFPVSISIRASGSATLDSLRRGSDAVLDSNATYVLVFAPMATRITFDLKVIDDGRVEPTEHIDLSLKTVDTTGRAGQGMVFTILDNDHIPDVEIVKPVDSLHTSDLLVPVEWTVDGKPQPITSDPLVQGWNILTRCFTDTAENRGCDSVHVWGDFTPPAVQVFKITGKNPHAATKDTTWWGDRARTRFGDDTVWYWSRDSILTSDGKSWRVVVDTHFSTTHFHGDSLFPVPVSVCDSVGNCGRDTGWIDLKQSIPQVDIVTPPPGAKLVVGSIPVLHSVSDAGKTWKIQTIETIRTPGITPIERCFEDDVGNVGCDKHNVDVEPIHVVSSTYYDSDGDGRPDVVVVDLDAKWIGSDLPTFDFWLNDSTRTGQKPDKSSPFFSGLTRGKLLVVGKDSLWVAAGTYLRDSAGNTLLGPDGLPMTNVLGDTARGTDGQPLRDSLGRVLFKVARTGQVDSTRLRIPLVPPFAFGMTGFDSLQGATMNANWVSIDSAGHKTTGSFVDSFKVDEKIPPVILKAEIFRTETYDEPDTLYVTPSEKIKIGSGKEWLEVWSCPIGVKRCDSASKVWVRVPADSVHVAGDGRYWFLVPPGDTGSIRPDYRVRFLRDVSDIKGNGIDTANTNWATPVTGAPRPNLVKVKPPTRIAEIPASEIGRKRPGAILLKVTNGKRSKNDWWEPGSRYNVDQAKATEACPVVDFCNGPTLYINRPARMIFYIYDQLGNYVTSRDITISQADLDDMRPDELDRVQVELNWNHHTNSGELVASGVYVWRIVSWVNMPGTAMPMMTNYLYKVGVKIHQP